MKKCLLVALTLFVVFLIHAVAKAQSEADRLEDKLSHYIETKMPGWKHKRGEPMVGTSKDVVTEFWASSNRVVKISIMPHKSADEAREAIREFVKYDREKQDLIGLGDEAYAWGFGLGN